MGRLSVEQIVDKKKKKKKTFGSLCPETRQDTHENCYSSQSSSSSKKAQASKKIRGYYKIGHFLPTLNSPNIFHDRPERDHKRVSTRPDIKRQDSSRQQSFVVKKVWGDRESCQGRSEGRDNCHFKKKERLNPRTDKATEDKNPKARAGNKP